MGASDDTPVTPVGVGCARVFWIMIGPPALAVLAYHVASKGGGWLTGLDVAYLAVLAALLAVRWLEFRSGFGVTAAGQPLNDAGLRRYLVMAGSVGLAVWVGANLVGNVWLAG